MDQILDRRRVVAIFHTLPYHYYQLSKHNTIMNTRNRPHFWQIMFSLRLHFHGLFTHWPLYTITVGLGCSDNTRVNVYRHMRPTPHAAGALLLMWLVGTTWSVCRTAAAACPAVLRDRLYHKTANMQKDCGGPWIDLATIMLKVLVGYNSKIPKYVLSFRNLLLCDLHTHLLRQWNSAHVDSFCFVSDTKERCTPKQIPVLHDGTKIIFHWPTNKISWHFCLEVICFFVCKFSLLVIETNTFRNVLNVFLLWTNGHTVLDYLTTINIITLNG